MLDRAARLGPLLGAAAAVAVVAVLDVPVMPAFLPIGDHPSYVAAPPALTLVEPVAHAPWFGLSPAPVRAGLAGAVLWLLWTATRRRGGSVAATVVVCAAVLSRPALRTPIALGADPALGVAAVWALGVACSGLPRGRRRWLVAAALAVGGVAMWPPLALVVPFVAALTWTDDGVAALAALGGAAAGLVSGLARWAARSSALGGEPVALGDVLAVLWAPPSGADPYVWPTLTAVALPAMLALVGIGSRLGAGPRRSIAATLAAAAATAAAVVVLPAWRPEIGRAVLWSSWPLAGAGLTWLAARAPAGRTDFAVALLGLALVVSGVAASAARTTGDERQRFGDALAVALGPLVAGGAPTFIAEDPRVDTAVVAWGSGHCIRRLRPVPRLVDAALDAGRRLYAGPSARTALELWGFRFVTRVAVAEPAPYAVAEVTGRWRCVPVAAPWRELPGLEYSGRLGLHLPRGTGQLEVVVLGPPPLTPRLTWADGRAAGRIAAVPIDLPSLPPVLWPGDGRLPDPSQVALRAELAARPDLAQDAALDLGQRAPLVAVRFTEPAHLTGVGTVCAAPLPRDPFAGAGRVPLDDPAFFAGGWHAVEGGATPFRWTARRAVVLVPAAAARAVELVLVARAAAAAAGPVSVAVQVNGWSAGSRPFGGADASARWPVPAGVWVAGTNEVVLDVSATARPSDHGSADTRELGLAVSSLRVAVP
ncbi:MAG: hypothetical protein AB7U83_12950 [Vicinamibacterales bacterium]